MTREEAISMLEQIGRHECIWMVCRHNEVYETIDIAIEALKEMSAEEWIKDIQSMICKVNDYYGYTDSMHMFKVLFEQKYHVDLDSIAYKKEGEKNE